MSYITGNPGNIQSAAEIVVSAYENISAKRLSVRYPDIVYPDFIPAESVDTNIAPGDDVHSMIFDDSRGIGAYRAVGSNDIPMVGFSQEKISVQLTNAAIGCALDVQDIARADAARARGLGVNAVEKKTETMKLGSDRHIERVVFFGNTIEDAGGDRFADGLINDVNVPATTVALGASGFTPWINGANSKTPDEVLFDLSVAVNTVYFTTRSIFRPDQIYLPLEQFAYITNLKAGTRANDETVFNFFSSQNVTMAVDGRQIEIKPLRYLKGAGAGGTDRMMVATKQPDNYMMGISIPFEQFSSQQLLLLMYFVAQYKFSNVKLLQPQAFGYWDGI